MLNVKRVQREVKRIHKDDETSGISIKVFDEDENDLCHLRGTITGPVDTPYENGKFDIDIRIPTDYPYNPPIMRFITKIWHPNISSQTGAICLNILKDDWIPTLTLRTALISLQALLSAPEPNDPQDAVVAQQYINDYPTFERIARDRTKIFAVASCKSVDEEKLRRFIDMGFSRDVAQDALEKSGGNEEEALGKLCSG